jgi:hypothetical protein
MADGILRNIGSVFGSDGHANSHRQRMRRRRGWRDIDYGLSSKLVRPAPSGDAKTDRPTSRIGFATSMQSQAKAVHGRIAPASHEYAEDAIHVSMRFDANVPAKTLPLQFAGRGMSFRLWLKRE